jgi:hypothetical protein
MARTPTPAAMRKSRRKKCNDLIGRLSIFLDEKGDTFGSLVKELGLSNGYFTRAKQGEGIIGADVIIAILELYRDLSPDWFLFGSGSIYRGGNKDEAKLSLLKGKKAEVVKTTTKTNAELSKTIKLALEMNRAFEKTVALQKEYLKTLHTEERKIVGKKRK